MPALRQKEETYAQAIVSGSTGADAYAIISPRASRKTATEKASRWARKSNIEARIAELRAAVATANAAREADVAREVAAKLKTTLLTMHERREIAAGIARSETVNPGVRLLALKLDAELSGDLNQKPVQTVQGNGIVLTEERIAELRAKKRVSIELQMKARDEALSAGDAQLAQR